jgi:hypothetical protein
VIRRWVTLLAAVVGALALLAGITVAVLVGLNAECTGSTSDCPRSDAYRYTLVVTPLVAAVVLLVGGPWGIRARRLWPLVLAEAVVLAAFSLVGVALGGAGIGTAVLFAAAVLLGGGALRRSAAV